MSVPAAPRPPRERPLHRRRRALVITGATLATLLAATPWLPDRTTPEAGLTPTTGGAAPTYATAGRGRVTPEMAAEIDRVVAQGLQARRVRAGSARELATHGVRCAEFEQQRYCLGVGWTTRTAAEIAQDVATSTPPGDAEITGDLELLDSLRQRARMAPQAQARLDRRELTDAATSVAKVWLLRHEVEGRALPAGFAARHPEVVATAAEGSSVDARTSGTTPATSARRATYPESSTVLSTRRVSSQNRYYWCGPGTMQMIGWGWSGRKVRQNRWANRLGTTTSGTAITEMVRVVNNRTGWDRADHAGTYITLDIGDYRFRKWYALVKRHVHDYRAPIVLHPVLLKKYFPYLDDDASGHFQVGRGYDTNPGGRPQIGYFEPWDQSRFDPSEPYISRVQWRAAYKSFRANKAHFQHNIGV